MMLDKVVAADLRGRQFRYYDFVMVAFVVILVLSNVVGAGKRAVIDLPWIGLWPFGAGILFFPLSYILDDVLTEVYGYARARRVVWAGFVALAFLVAMEWTTVALPPAADWGGQAHYEYVFGSPPHVVSAFPYVDVGIGGRIAFASLCAFWVGDLLNSYALARMKILTDGKWLWTRTIGSTIVGEGADSLVFYPLAFYGLPDWPVQAMLMVMASQFVLKVGWEVLLTPVTYAVVGFLKRREGIDVYDRGTDFSPFHAGV
ncbi:queuosine precursor transporter [Sphingomonas sp. H39-1-10]|uniref:queuosine precursor transporter n=1 Tax=Sphingomonas pollutisoli TaxID=3030829 RepID=UPI0023B9FC97|nr:queuosine precursor transporter [Sphingomonas pollutisoli]MDF0487213.1 queuosine precursor transporter [Sphingomonas pollutisoli]